MGTTGQEACHAQTRMRDSFRPVSRSGSNLARAGCLPNFAGASEIKEGGRSQLAAQESAAGTKLEVG